MASARPHLGRTRFNTLLVFIGTCLAFEAPALFAVREGAYRQRHRDMRRVKIRIEKDHGKETRTSATGIPGGPVLRKDKVLLPQMSEAASIRNWSKISNLFRQSSMSVPSLFNAAMTGAFRCGEYEEGAAIYRQLNSSGLNKTGPSFNSGLKLFARLGLQEEVHAIWKEVEHTNFLEQDDKPWLLMGSMIDAVSQAGNVTAAVHILDLMRARRLEPDAPAWGSALKACRHSKDATAAMFLLDAHAKASVPPDCVAYTFAMGAHQSSPLELIKERARFFLKLMNTSKIVRSPQFVDEHVGVVLARTFISDQESEVRDVVAKTSLERRLEARWVIDGARQDGIRQTMLVARIDRVLRDFGD